MTVIHQVTDPHVSPDGKGVACENFLALMAHVRETKPDLLTITGDLPGEDGSRAAYEWIKAALPDNVPCLVLPGNHDDEQVVFDVFKDELNTNPLFSEVLPLEEIDLVFLNTASTWLPVEQVQFLTEGEIRPGSVLFVHHPTRTVADGYMDRVWPLQNREEVNRAVSASGISHVFCGHYHCEHEMQTDYGLYITPSPAFEVDLHAVEPKIGPPRIPLREINVTGRRVSSTVRYL